MFFIIKHIHMVMAAISISLFVTRACWSVRDSALLRQKWVRIVPHLIDTFLLGSAIYLMVSLQAWPTVQPWVAAKLIALLAYILVGTVAIRTGKTARGRTLASVVAVCLFAYIVGAARTHDPMSWLAYTTLSVG